jgi:hypothetical protein
MTRTEMKVVRKLKQEGYQVYRNGWPDLLAIKGTRVRLIEVKQYSWEDLSPLQKKMHKALKKHWHPVEVLYICGMRRNEYSFRGTRKQRDNDRRNKLREIEDIALGSFQKNKAKTFYLNA